MRGAVFLSARRLAALRRQAATQSAAAMPAYSTASAAAPQPTAHPIQHQERRNLEARSDTGLSLAAPPVVYHPLYSAPVLPPGHRFPMVSRTGWVDGRPCLASMLPCDACDDQERQTASLSTASLAILLPPAQSGPSTSAPLPPIWSAWLLVTTPCRPCLASSTASYWPRGWWIHARCAHGLMPHLTLCSLLLRATMLMHTPRPHPGVSCRFGSSCCV
jgi:hypothetical protein